MKKTQTPAAPTPQQAAQGLYHALSLSRKAGKLVMGYDPVIEAVQTGQTQTVYLAADISPKTAERLSRAVEDLAKVASLPFTQDQLAAISRKAVAVYAVADSGLAHLCETKYMQCKDLELKEDIRE